MKPRAWYDPATGGFYISERTIPDHIRDRVIPLYEHQPQPKVPR